MRLSRRLLRWHRVAAVSNVNLLVASLDLQMVQSLLGAIRAADRHGAGQLPVAVSPIDSYCRRPVIHPQPRYLPRPVLHPTPRYLPRPVIHPQPRVEPPCSSPPCPKSSVPHITAGPQPPWKILPWQEPAAAPNVIKIIMRPPDIVTKGNLLDLFL
ncbi:MAG: hypothetical protein ABSD28_10085 [Tepidisphaeraceae bacterium]